MTKLMELATLQPKRPINTKRRGVRKKQRIKDLLSAPVCTPHRLVFALFQTIIPFTEFCSLYRVCFNVAILQQAFFTDT